MKFVQRLGYYLGGFAIGIILLMFFLNGKKASCDYGPNARTVKNISSKTISYSKKAQLFMNNNGLDTTVVKNLIKYGDVDFTNSNTELDSCKIYQIDNVYKERQIQLSIENCFSISKILDMNYINE
ncbi:hypothetical protein [Winogradskyella sp. KYW1333]|jgi:hypothetical protein|uniref:hypothetical protein n=1 Tax=unclassified Winogradskyella TaxID=2615021 RepID=UPI000DF377F7|nr:hypothetical protein [Winogradskyella sp. KYW1333]RCT54249.1 hypothetical protein DUZ96_08505 [Winogradskyella sp. KYW1333]